MLRLKSFRVSAFNDRLDAREANAAIASTVGVVVGFLVSMVFPRIVFICVQFAKSTEDNVMAGRLRIDTAKQTRNAAGTVKIAGES
jgi:hypothetical protein